jgi:hypothetical protein
MPWVTINGNHVFIGPKGAATSRKPTLSDLSVEDVDRIAAKAQRLKTLPVITSAKGEQITVSVSTNPFHGVMDRAEGNKPFAMETHVDGELNDHQQFGKYETAVKRATAWHKVLAREEAQAAAKKARGKRY